MVNYVNCSSTHWLEQKLKQTNFPSLISDFRFLDTPLQHEIKLLKKSLMLSAKAIEKNPNSIGPQLLEKDIRTEGKSFNSGLLLGISKYGTPERGLSITKTVHIDNSLENRGLFFGIYQGYNGSYVANLCARELHKEIKEHLHHFSDISENSEIIRSAFQEAYRKIDKIQLIGEGEHPWKRWSGCSAVACLLVS